MLTTGPTETLRGLAYLLSFRMHCVTPPGGLGA